MVSSTVARGTHPTEAHTFVLVFESSKNTVSANAAPGRVTALPSVGFEIEVRNRGTRDGGGAFETETA